MIRLGRIQVRFMPDGNSAWGNSTGSGALYSLSPKLTFGLSCCIYILYYLPLTMNISKAHGLCFMALNSSPMMET